MMRHLVFICRPCLASIRNQQARQPPSRSIVSLSTRPNSRTRPTSFAALHALSRSNSTTGGTVLDPDDAYDELERALAAHVARDKPQKRQADDAEDVDDWAVPSAAGQEQGSNKPLTVRDQNIRSLDQQWDEIEPLMLGYDVVHESAFRGVGNKGWGRNPWEWLCQRYVETSQSISHELSVYNTSEEYFAAIDGDKELRASRSRVERWLCTMFDTWFPAIEKERRPKPTKKGFVLLLPPSEEKMEAMRKKWQSLSPLLRDFRWPGLMTKCLRFAPRSLPYVLQVTMEQRIARPYIVEKVMRLLGNQIIYYRVEDQPAFADSVAMAMLCVLRNTPPNKINFSQETVFRIMKSVSTKRVAELYRALKKYDFEFMLDTRMHFASRLAKDVTYRPEALEIVRDLIHKDKLDINSVTGSALATSLLAIQNDDPGTPNRFRAASPPAIVEELNETLLAAGLNPNIINFTAIMQTLCEIRQLGKAWKVFEFMLGQGIEPDETALLVLLHGSKLCLNYDSARNVVQMAIERGMHHRPFWNEVLHLVFTSALRKQVPRDRGAPRSFSMFSPMCFVYNKFFDPEPLQKLMITNLSHHSLDESGARSTWDLLWPYLRLTWPILKMLPNDREILQPGTDTLYIMLVGYVRGFTRSINIQAFWKHFERVLKSGDPVPRQMVTEGGPKMHNIILLALCEHADMLPLAVEILTTMLNDTIQAELLAQAGVKDDIPRHPPPDIRSWGIVLYGFMRHKRHREAEAILDMMRQHGLPPNISTYNQLLAGYTRSHEVHKAFDVMDRIRREGLEPDAFTSSIFADLSRSPETARLMAKMVAERKKLRGNSQHMSYLADSRRSSAIGEFMQLRDELAELGGEIHKDGGHLPAGSSTAEQMGPTTTSTPKTPPRIPSMIRQVVR